MSLNSLINRPRLDQLPEWKALARHRKTMAKTSITDLFAADSRRGSKCSTEALGIHFDWSKHLVTAPERLVREVVNLLVDLRLAERVEMPADAEDDGDASTDAKSGIRLLPAAGRFLPPRPEEHSEDEAQGALW